MTRKYFISIRLIIMIAICWTCAVSSNKAQAQPVWKIKTGDFQQLQNTFEQPPLWYAPHTFWFWDAPIDEPQTTEMAKQMSRQRLNPGYTHARRGLPKDQWLSEEWFDAFGKALAEAKKAGTTLGYNDEYLWPSGQAVGRVLESHPELKAVSLKYHRKAVEGESVVEVPESKFSVAARLNEKDQIIANTLSVIGSGQAFQWEVPAGKWAIYIYETYHHAGIDGGLVNYLDPGLMDVFIPIAHESYESRFKDDMGRSIPGVFVDNEGDFGWKMAWSEYLPSRYQEMKNRDIRTWMPLLTYEDDEGLWAKARYDWFDVVSDIYCNHFIGRLSNWLEEREMYYITNLWEESLMLITKSVGDLMRAQRSVTLPGNDAIDMRAQSVHDFKETQSVCEFEDRPFMCEIMGVRGWGQTPEEMKRTVNLVTAWGVNHIVAHGIYNNRKLTSIPYPPDWYNENPYFEYLNLWTDFSRRASYVNRQGKLIADVLLINPLESIWALSDSYFREPKPGANDEGRQIHQASSAWNPKVFEIDRTYSDAMETLTTSNIDYLIADRHYMETAVIDKLTNDASGSKNKLRIGDHSFSAVILPPSYIISRVTAQKVLDFARAGGTVVLLGDLPEGSPEKGAFDSLVIEQMHELISLPQVINLADETEKMDLLPEVLDKQISPQFRKVAGDLNLVFSHRDIDGNDFYWIASRSDHSGACTLSLRDGEGRAEIWDCETGEVLPVEYEKSESRNLVRLELQPYQAYWLVFNSNEEPYHRPGTGTQTREILLDDAPWQMSLPKSDIVKVSTAQILVSPNEHIDEDFLNIPEDEWAWQKILGEVKITEPWRADMFYIPEPKTTLYYRYNFVIKDNPEQGFLHVSADDMVTLWVNGNKLTEGENSRIWFKTDTYPIGKYLREGKNTIAVEVINTGGPGSFMLQGRYETNKGEIGRIRTNPEWKELGTKEEGWYKQDYNDDSWNRPSLATEKIYKERIELFDNPKKSIGPKEYLWWKLFVPPGAVEVNMPEISEESVVFSNSDQLSLHNSIVHIPAGAKQIFVRHDPKQNPGFLTSPLEFSCTGKSRGAIGSWFNYGLHKFSGVVDYETTFHLDQTFEDVILDLGRVSYLAEVWINGNNAGSRLWRPFTFDISDFVKEGENEIRIRVGNLVVNEMSLIHDVEESINFWGRTGIPLLKDLDAGLFGPVKISIKEKHPVELLLCGKQEVSIIRFEDKADTVYEKVWSWYADDALNFPDSLVEVFYATDECKSVNHGKQVLITASWRGGAALIDRQTKDILFYALCPNAHSAELLPGNRIVVAVSTAEGGNRLALYDLNRSNHIIFQDSLYSGHGVIWDESREILWALGYDELRAYSLVDWESDTPSLKLEDAYKIPGISGHDLMSYPETPYLIITEEGSAWKFDRDAKVFSEFDELKGLEHMKSVMIHPEVKQLVYVQADTGKSSSDTLRFLNPDKTMSFPGHSFYKARWVLY